MTSGSAPRAYGHRYRHRHGYRAWPRGYGYRGLGWGYTSPARIYGDPYAAWSSTSIPESRRYLNTAPPIAASGAVSVLAPTFTHPGPLAYGEVGHGPSLFGTETSSGYGYTSGYRHRRGYGYRGRYRYRGGYGYAGGYGNKGAYGYYSGTYASGPAWAWRRGR